MLSQRAQMSVTDPRSRVTEGSSQRAASGCRFGSKTRNAKSAAAQIAARLQRKISTAGLRACLRGRSLASTCGSRSR